jgi:serine-type D-Ala-D-Ala carboxypeptidase/endopeptidase (penicillin-binding protein 4)
MHTASGMVVARGWGQRLGARVAAALVAGAALVSSGSLALGQGAAGAGGGLERRMSSAVEKAKLGTADVGISVVDVQSGRELVGISRGSKRGTFVPASNLKLLTSGAAVLVLGPSYEFETQFILSGDKLFIKGSGDPALGDPELLDKMHLSLDGFFAAIVESIQTELKAQAAGGGVSGIREIIVDDRVFDRESVHPDWPTEQLNRAYCAQVSGVNFHGNIVNVYVSPGAGIGAEAIARMQPSAPWLTLRRLARTVREGSTEVWLDRDKDAYAFRLHGTVRTALDRPVSVTIDGPALMFGRLLADRLDKSSLGLMGKTPSVRLAGAAEVTPSVLGEAGGSARLAASVKTPLSVVLERCNVDSDNLYAESLLKLVGHKATGQPGSWSNGSAVVRMQVKERLGGDEASKLVMNDGSGLSRNNRVTPGMLTKWLASVAKAPGGGMFVESLALAGEEGTLKRRFKGSKLVNEVRAKSGYIRNVRTLSGYVTDPDSKRQLAFSVLVDDVPAGADQRSKVLHEDVVELVDAHLAELTGRSGAKRGAKSASNQPTPATTQATPGRGR